MRYLGGGVGHRTLYQNSQGTNVETDDEGPDADEDRDEPDVGVDEEPESDDDEREGSSINGYESNDSDLGPEDGEEEGYEEWETTDV